MTTPQNKPATRTVEVPASVMPGDGDVGKDLNQTPGEGRGVQDPHQGVDWKYAARLERIAARVAARCPG